MEIFCMNGVLHESGLTNNFMLRSDLSRQVFSLRFFASLFPKFEPKFGKYIQEVS